MIPDVFENLYPERVTAHLFRGVVAFLEGALGEAVRARTDGQPQWDACFDGRGFVLFNKFLPLQYGFCDFVTLRAE